MPIITVFPDVVRAYNRVEVNWADTPSVEFAKVLRVDVETGTCTPLRPYICFSGDYLALSCGHGIFWDTEVPLDRQVYYITEGLNAPCIPNTEPLFLDTYTRVLVDSFGSTETGSLGPLPYVLSGGTNPGNYDVNGGKGRITLDTDGINRNAVIDIGQTNFDLYADLSINQLALTQDVTTRVVARFTDTDNNYQAGINWSPDGTILIFLTRILGGAQTALAPILFNFGSYAPNTEFTVRFQGIGNNFKMKVWPTGLLEPDPWAIEATDTPQPLNATFVGLLTRREGGNTNVGLIASIDNFTMPDACLPCTPVTAESEPSTMPSNGAFRLKDPVRPCNDIYMPLCFEQPNNADVNGPYCIPGSGVFFGSMDTETFESNALILNPTNAEFPLAITRTRRGVSSELEVVTRTFADRDNLKKISKPGSPLLLQGPPQYGIPDQYIAVGNIDYDRGLTDHKFQVRIVGIPHTQVARPAGPTQGVCGSQVGDLCDFTWQQLADSGFTWDDLVRGRGSGDLVNYRTWDQVKVEFANWNAVDDGTRTWTGLEMGD